MNRFAIATTLLFASTLRAEPPRPSDERIAGYAEAVLDRDSTLSSESLSVTDGVIHLDGRGVGASERQRLTGLLRNIRGVVDVRIEGDNPMPATRDLDASASVRPSGPATEFSLDTARLFAPLLADPRWPHFYASYAHVSDGTLPDDLLNVGFGESFSFFRQTFDGGKRVELGLQAGIFALFTYDDGGLDLINADYFVGPTIAYRDGNFSLLGRLFHQSSHLGDDYLLDSQANRDGRFNVSYEAVDLLASYDLPAGFRVYGGGGFIVHRDPAELERWLIEYGAEWRSPKTYLDGLLRPIAAADFQHREATDFDLNLSFRTGVELESKTGRGQLQILLEYYNGQNPNGQFYDDRIEYFGIGTHFYF